MSLEIVLGPPGCGKTETLLGLVDEELSRGVSPDRVGYVSFTRRAADEASDRAQKKFKLTARQLPWFRTIHSLCFFALGLSSAEVMEGKKLSEFGDWVGVSVSGKVSTEEGTTFGFDTGDRCLFMDNLARVRGIHLRQQYEEDSDNLPWSLVERVSRGYAEYKAARGLHDFTDMLSEFVRSEWSARLEVLFVDEAQDLSLLQWQVVGQLSRGTRRVIVAGDDDQSIYRWSGAAVDHFIALQGQEFVLNQSWRVPRNIQTVAAGIIGRVRTRREKSWLPRSGDEGLVRRVSSLDEIDFSTGEETLVLARNTCFLRDDAMRLLRHEGILYSFRGGWSVQRSVVQAIRTWERLRRGEQVTIEEALRVYERMTAGVGYERGHKKLPHWTDKEALVGLAELRENGGLLTDVIWHEALDRVSAEDRTYMVRALRRGEKMTAEPSVHLSTIHGSKGGQADHVVVMRDMAQRTAREADHLTEDEARTWYVAVTRAKIRLTIVRPQTRHGYDI